MSEVLVNLAEKALAVQEKIDVMTTAFKSKVTPLEKELEELETTLVNLMTESKLETVRSKNAVVDRKTKTRVSFADFDVFGAFVLRRKALHLFERRIAQKAYQELKDSLGGKAIPGLKEFDQVYVNVRRA